MKSRANNYSGANPGNKIEVGDTRMSTTEAVPKSFAGMAKSRFFKGEDVIDNPRRLTIKRFEDVNVALEDDTPDMKWAVYFNEDEHGLVINATRREQLSELFPDGPLSAIGLQVTLKAGQANFKGKKVTCIDIVK